MYLDFIFITTLVMAGGYEADLVWCPLLYVNTIVKAYISYLLFDHSIKYSTRHRTTHQHHDGTTAQTVVSTERRRYRRTRSDPRFLYPAAPPGIHLPYNIIRTKYYCTHRKAHVVYTTIEVLSIYELMESSYALEPNLAIGRFLKVGLKLVPVKGSYHISTDPVNRNNL